MKTIPECSNRECASMIIVANSARNFKNPTLAVEEAVKNGLIKSGQNILEIGSGNLRNLAFVSEKIARLQKSAYEVDSTLRKYDAIYDSFKKTGGVILSSYPNKNKYNVIICTFVLETICPKARRYYLIKRIKQSLRPGGLLVASFRGVSGVNGTKYKECYKKEGWLTPLHTFIRPYSIKEVKSLLKFCGFTKISLLQDYRVDTPKNIHFVAG
ncbi:MAG: methyltransferase domain-containing protein [Thermoplasmata archaeon]|nr:methyltransferase domain-containing protein [Thermoplasmata archaeon]